MIIRGVEPGTAASHHTHHGHHGGSYFGGVTGNAILGLEEFGGEGTQQSRVEGSSFGILFTDLLM
jgi:hypothetical protein